MPDPDNAFGKRTRFELPETTQPDEALREGRPGRGWLIIFSAAITLVIVMTFITVSGWRSDTARMQQGPATSEPTTTGSAPSEPDRAQRPTTR